MQLHIGSHRPSVRIHAYAAGKKLKSGATMRTGTQIAILFSEVEAQLEKLVETAASQARRRWLQQQHTESALRSYGIKTSEIRKLIRPYTGWFEALGLEAKFELARMFTNRVFSNKQHSETPSHACKHAVRDLSGEEREEVLRVKPVQRGSH
jgi:hypothetical protein